MPQEATRPASLSSPLVEVPPSPTAQTRVAPRAPGTTASAATRAAASTAASSPARCAACRRFPRWRRTTAQCGNPGDRGAQLRPLLVTLSGLDGAGKTTAAEDLRARLEARGRPAEVAWARLGAEREVLDSIALPVKRVVRRRGTVSDPEAVGPLATGKVRDPRESSGRRPAVSWVWIAIVALANARSYRRAAAERRRRGVTLVCDRWATDALVDLELRYGRHRLARAILRRLPPRPDLQVLLELDAATAAARKPGDQAERVLREAEGLYETEAAAAGAHRIDARLAPEAIASALLDLVEAVERAEA